MLAYFMFYCIATKDGVLYLIANIWHWRKKNLLLYKDSACQFKFIEIWKEYDTIIVF